MPYCFLDWPNPDGDAIPVLWLGLDKTDSPAQGGRRDFESGLPGCCRLSPAGA
jgi:hypothetical protein